MYDKNKLDEMRKIADKNGVDKSTINNMMNKLSDDDKKKINDILNDKEKLNKILSDTAISDFIKKFGGLNG